MAKSSGAGPAAASPQKGKRTRPSAQKKQTVRGKEVPDAVKAAIMGALLSGQFQHDSDIAEHLKVSKGTISKYKDLIPPEYLEQVRTQKKDQIGEMVMGFLEHNFESLKSVDAFINDPDLGPEWIGRQGAAELATFYGVKADKNLKLLELIEAASAPEPDVQSVVEQDS
jgi:hypothetical protein